MVELLGEIVKGKVVRLEEYGAFVEVDIEGVLATGLVHVSEVAVDYVENIYAYLAEGDEVDVRVLEGAEGADDVEAHEGGGECLWDSTRATRRERVDMAPEPRKTWCAQRRFPESLLRVRSPMRPLCGMRSLRP